MISCSIYIWFYFHRFVAVSWCSIVGWRRDGGWQKRVSTHGAFLAWWTIERFMLEAMRAHFSLCQPLELLYISRSHSPSISLSFSVDLSHGDIYLLLFVFSFLSTHTTCSWCLRVFALCLKRWRQGRRWGFEGLTEESEHTRWFLSMSAMLGAVRAHSLSVSHSSGPSLFFPLLYVRALEVSLTQIDLLFNY